MRFKAHTDYIKTFDYVSFYKRKSCEYFKPITKLFYDSNEEKQLECVILNPEIIKRIHTDGLQMNYTPSVIHSCSTNLSSSLSLDVLNKNVLERMRVR